MLILEYIDVPQKTSNYDFNVVWGLYFNKICDTVTTKNGKYNGIIVTDVPICKLPAFVCSLATRIIDTANWGVLKNTTPVKVISDEMKEDYLMAIMTTKKFIS